MAIKKPGAMVALMIAAMIIGSLFSITWPIVAPFLRNRSAMGSSPPPANSTPEQQGAYYLAAMKEAKEKQLEDNMIPTTVLNYADWLLWDANRIPEARKYYQECAELCGPKENGPASQLNKACAIRQVAWCDHLLFMRNEGKAPNPLPVVEALKVQDEIAHTLHQEAHPDNLSGHRRTLNELGEIYCDNANFEQANDYFDKALKAASGAPSNPNEFAHCLVGKARVLANTGDSAGADKLFRQAVTVSDTAYGGGSYASEGLIRQYALYLKKAGQSERSKRIAQLQDDE